MNKVTLGFVAAAVCGLSVSSVSAAEGGNRAFNASLSVGAAYDDNYNNSSTNKLDSIEAYVSLDLSADFNMENTFLSLRYRPRYSQWMDRDDDSNDLHHNFDVVYNHTFSSKLSLGINDSLMYQELPELRQDGSLIRESNDYFYNTLSGTLAYNLSSRVRTDVSGRHVMLRYEDNDGMADRENYDIVVGSASLRRQFSPEMSVAGYFSYEDINYQGKGKTTIPIRLPGNRVEQVETVIPDRGAQTLQYGAGLEQTFSPNLVGSLRGGMTAKQFDAANADEETSPYGEVSLTFLPSPATRLSVGASRSFSKSDVITYVNSDRTSFSGGIGHDLTGRISLGLNASYSLNEYDAKQTVDTVEVAEMQDGEETIITLGATASYRFNRRNWMDFNYTRSDLSSDLRDEYKRNRFGVNWRTRL